MANTMEYCGPFGWHSVPALPAEVEALLRAVRPTNGAVASLTPSTSRLIGFGSMTTRFWPESKPCGRGLLDRLLIVDSDDDLWLAVEAIEGYIQR